MARASIIAILGLGVIVVAALWLTGIGPLLLGRWSFIQWAETDRGTYFRVKVDVDYKGEPQPFDIVVGCNVRRIRYKDGSGTYEAGLIPTVYGRRMSDGQALVVRPPDACNGQTTANGKVPPNFIPLMIVYDDADTLDFGVAYLSDDAYASPLSDLTFHEASIETATREEFDDFRENGPPNVVTPNSYFSIQPQRMSSKRRATRKSGRPSACVVMPIAGSGFRTKCAPRLGNTGQPTAQTTGFRRRWMAGRRY